MIHTRAISSAGRRTSSAVRKPIVLSKTPKTQPLIRNTRREKDLSYRWMVRAAWAGPRSSSAGAHSLLRSFPRCLRGGLLFFASSDLSLRTPRPTKRRTDSRCRAIRRGETLEHATELLGGDRLEDFQHCFGLRIKGATVRQQREFSMRPV